MEKSGSQFERSTSRLPHMRLRPCKHCAALARRRSCRFSPFWTNDFLDQRFETRIAMQRIEQWIDLDPADVGAVAFLETLFEPAQRFIFIVQAQIKQSAQIANHLTVLTDLIKLGQHL